MPSVLPEVSGCRSSVGAPRARAFLSLGSNLEPEKNTEAFLRLVAEHPHVRIVAISTFYRTPALPRPGTGIWDDPPFLNGVVEVETSLSAPELSDLLRKWEEELGRVRGPDRYAPRTMDADLLLYLGRGPSGLLPPHPDVLERPFVAIPLMELDPDLVLEPGAVPLRQVAARFPGPGGEPELAFTNHLRAVFLGP